MNGLFIFPFAQVSLFWEDLSKGDFIADVEDLAEESVIKPIDHLLNEISNLVAELDWALEHVGDKDLCALADVDEFDCAGVRVHSQRVGAQIVIHSKGI